MFTPSSRSKRNLNPLDGSEKLVAVSRESTEPIILLAEDSENDVLMFLRAFKQSGYESPLQVVSNGEEALAYLKGEGKFANREEYPLPTLLLLDLKMPRKDGFEVLQWIRKQDSLSSLVVVVLTTSERVQDINRAYSMGANSFLTKPLDIQEFRHMLSSLYTYWLVFNRPAESKRPMNGNGKHKSGTAPK